MDESEVLRDPSTARNRIFIGNIPLNCTREEIQNLFAKFGPILAVLVQKNFAFVQFENETVAHKASSLTSGSMLRGKKITVRIAGASAKKKLKTDNMQERNIGDCQNMIPPAPMPPYQDKDYNDCEIVVVNKDLTQYAEYIEHRLRRLGLTVDLLYPNEQVPIGKVLANISSRGCLYAILVTPQNQEHRSITVNILYGQPAEHRNMPVEDAIELVVHDFRNKLKGEQPTSSSVQTPMAVPIIPAQSMIAPPLKERHPDAIQNLLNLLADNMPLTVLQYDRIIKYLTERRELQLVVELGDAADMKGQSSIQMSTAVADKPDPEIELQKKILNILNKPTSITETPKPEMVYPNVKSLEKDLGTIELLKDTRIQRALDSLMKTNLVSTIENHFKF